jgi:hypothetical protein
VAHACNPSYSEGREQEDRGSEPAWVSSSGDPILKKPTKIMGWWSSSRCRPHVQAPVPAKRKKETTLFKSHVVSQKSREQAYSIRYKSIAPLLCFVFIVNIPPNFTYRRGNIRPMPVIPALGRLGQEDLQFHTSLTCIGRPYLKNKQKKVFFLVFLESKTVKMEGTYLTECLLAS